MHQLIITDMKLISARLQLLAYGRSHSTVMRSFVNQMNKSFFSLSNVFIVYTD